MYACRDICDTSKYDANTYTDSVNIILVRYRTRLTLSTCCTCFAKNMMIMYQSFLVIWYVSPYGPVVTVYV